MTRLPWIVVGMPLGLAVAVLVVSIPGYPMTLVHRLIDFGVLVVFTALFAVILMKVVKC